MLEAVYREVVFPLLLKMLDRQGNSNIQERIDLVNRFTSIFSKRCIKSLVADREFVGVKWIAFLNQENIRYHIHIRNNFKVFIFNKAKES